VKSVPARSEFGLEAPLVIEYLLKNDVGQAEVGVDGRQFAPQRLIEGGHFGLVHELMLDFSPGVLHQGPDLDLGQDFLLHNGA
jgi:hypothetical protein